MLDTLALGNLIKDKRKELKLTQKELALQLGVVNTAVFKYEKGIVNNIPIEIKLRLIDVLKLNPSDVLPSDLVDKYFTGHGYKVHGEWKHFKRKNESLSEAELKILHNEDEQKKEDFLNGLVSILPTMLKDTYGFISDDILAIDTSILSQDDQERILGILAKYNKPRIKL